MCFSDLENIECLMQKRNKARLVTEEGRRGQNFFGNGAAFSFHMWKETEWRPWLRKESRGLALGHRLSVGRRVGTSN